MPNHAPARQENGHIARKCVFKLTFRDWHGANMDGCVAVGVGMRADYECIIQLLCRGLNKNRNLVVRFRRVFLSLNQRQRAVHGTQTLIVFVFLGRRVVARRGRRTDRKLLK
jgi:hypothetical protein